MKKHQTINDFLSEAIGRHFANALVAADLHQHRVDPSDTRAATELLTDDLKYRPDAVVAALTTSTK